MTVVFEIYKRTNTSFTDIQTSDIIRSNKSEQPFTIIVFIAHRNVDPTAFNRKPINNAS